MTEARKLAAILVTDIVGFSRLAGADEDRDLGAFAHTEKRPDRADNLRTPRAGGQTHG
jgi:hypothetical protein